MKKQLTMLVAAGVMACGEDSLGPGNISVTSEPNAFLLQITDLDLVTDRATYGWTNDGTQATVDITQFITAGSVAMTIKDADGTVVHQANVEDDNDTDTAVGTAGRWMIELDLAAASGGFTLDIKQKL